MLPLLSFSRHWQIYQLYYKRTISPINVFTGYQQHPGLLTEIESKWDQLASNIFEYSDTLPPNRRQEVALKIKHQYLGGKPVSQETYGRLIEVRFYSNAKEEGLCFSSLYVYFFGTTCSLNMMDLSLILKNSRHGPPNHVKYVIPSYHIHNRTKVPPENDETCFIPYKLHSLS